MTEDTTARYALPLLHAGQAEKELFHNEALAIVDALLSVAVRGAGLAAPPTTVADGDAWIVGAAPSGPWTGRAGQLAVATAGGWRFVAPREGLRAWDAATRRELVYVAGTWEAGVVRGTRLVIDGDAVVGPRRPPIAVPAGGAIVDAEARGAVAAILTAMRSHGLIAT